MTQKISVKRRNPIEDGEQPGVFSTAEFTLARVLFETMEHLDPQEDRPWEDLREDEREYFCLCVRALLCRYDLIAAALGRKP